MKIQKTQSKVRNLFTTPIRIAIALALLVAPTTPGKMSTARLDDSASLQVSIPQPASYDIEEIPSLSGNLSIAYGINGGGQVVGFSMNGAGCCAQAFRFTPPANAEFWPYAPITYGHAINDNGVIAGEQNISGGGGGYWAFLSSGPSNVTPLGPRTGPLPGYTNSQALAINNWNEVAADAYTGTTIRRAILFSNGQVTDLGTLTGGGNSYSRGINDHTQVVGYAHQQGYNPQDPRWEPGHASVWQNGAPIVDLNDLVTGANTFELRMATAINNSGQIVGFAGSQSQNVIRAFLLKPVCPNPLPRRRWCANPRSYSFFDLGTFENGGISYALALNNAAAAVGAAYEDATGIGNNLAALFTHHRAIKLNELLGRLDGLNWKLLEATGINDNGEIVGWGIHNGVLRAFKLTPRAHIEVRGQPLLNPNKPGMSALTVQGTGFSGQDDVEVEVHYGDIGGELVKRIVLTTGMRGDFSWNVLVPCAADLAVSAWDRKSGAYSNAGSINIPCLP